jgi:hypothetical protein
VSSELVLPRLRPDQWEIITDPAKVKVVAAGRRFGKTVLGQCATLPPASIGAKTAWIVPNYSNGRPLWAAAVNACQPLVSSKLVKINNSERTILFPRTGGFLAMFSADSENSVRGSAFDIAVCDEAGQISEQFINESLAPCLADTAGVLYLIGTPHGRSNGFHKAYCAALEDLSGHSRAWHASSLSNPNPNIQAYVEAARLRISSRSFRQEYLAEFIEGSGSVFSGIMECATIPLTVEPYKGDFVMGCDWARQHDYTCLSVIDVNSKKVVEILRFNQCEWEIQRQRLTNLSNKWNCQSILAERNSIGDVLIEALQKEGLPISGWTATNATKSQVIQSLILAIENQNIFFQPIPSLIAELESFEMSVLPSGLTRYAAAEGCHDDHVVSLGLALKAADTGVVRYHDTPW